MLFFIVIRYFYRKKIKSYVYKSSTGTRTSNSRKVRLARDVNTYNWVFLRLVVHISELHAHFPRRVRGDAYGVGKEICLCEPDALLSSGGFADESPSGEGEPVGGGGGRTRGWRRVKGLSRYRRCGLVSGYPRPHLPRCLRAFATIDIVCPSVRSSVSTQFFDISRFFFPFRAPTATLCENWWNSSFS